MQISVVIASYNRGDSLAALLTDLSEQTGLSRGFDVTVVDDGSTPPLAPVTRARDWPFEVQLIAQSNRGATRARDAGIRASRGELIVLLDDDMRVQPNFLAAHAAAHARGDEVVLGPILAPADLSERPLFERFHARQLALLADDLRSGRQIPGAALCTGNVSLRRARYLEVGGFDPTLQRSEDRDLGIRLERTGARFGFEERARVTHHSDHSRLDVWLRRAFEYGIYDSRIARKHHGHAHDPWQYLVLVHPLARPLLLSAVLWPAAGELLGRAAFFAAELSDDLGLERLALNGVTLAYGTQYFRGVRAEHGSLTASARGLWACMHGR